jgi:hypothetical protein
VFEKYKLTRPKVFIGLSLPLKGRFGQAEKIADFEFQSKDQGSVTIKFFTVVIIIGVL